MPCSLPNLGTGMGGSHDGLELYQYFTASCFEGYGDDEEVCVRRAMSIAPTWATEAPMLSLCSFQACDCAAFSC